MEIVNSNKVVIEKVHDIMVALRTPLASAKLHQFTKLRPLLDCPTRWGSSFLMLQRYFDLKKHLPKLGIANIDDAFPSAAETRALQKVFEDLQKLQSVSLSLQKESIAVDTARVLFDGVTSFLHALTRQFLWDADIVHSKTFERAIVKIQKEEIESLTPGKKESFCVLQYNGHVGANVSTKAVETAVSFAEEDLKKRKVEKQERSGCYVDIGLCFLLQTS